MEIIKTKHNKVAISTSDQIRLLESKGLIIEDHQRAIDYLEWQGFYRLRPYLKLFRNPSEESEFLPKSYFNDVKRIYEFDAKIRPILFKACQIIEVGLRTQMIHYFSIEHGPNWYENRELYTEKFAQTQFSEIRNSYLIMLEKCKTRIEFLVHYYNKYDSCQNPPAWMMLELFSFKHLVNTFIGLSNYEAKKTIMNNLGLNFPVLKSWLPVICGLRNSCAHHYRLYNKLFDTLIYPNQLGNYSFIQNSNSLLRDRLYYISCCLFFLVDRIHPHLPYRSLKNDFRSALMEFAKKSPSRLSYQTHLGLPPDWEHDPFWETPDLTAGNT
jgi:abortive infection bacteriophage resistance protein